MPFYSAFPASGYLINTLQQICDSRGISSFKLSKETNLSPTTTRKIYSDQHYIPSPDVIETLCLSLKVQPGELLQISDTIVNSWQAASGAFLS